MAEQDSYAKRPTIREMLEKTFRCTGDRMADVRDTNFMEYVLDDQYPACSTYFTLTVWTKLWVYTLADGREGPVFVAAPRNPPA